MTSLGADTITSPRLDVGRGDPLFEDEPRTIPEIFHYAAKTFQLDDALNYNDGKGWRHIASAEMMARIGDAINGFRALGLRSGDRAAIFAQNSPDWTITDAACQFAGVIDVPIYTTLSPDSIRYILSDSGASVLFLGDVQMYGTIRAVLPELPAIRKLIFFDSHGIEGIASATSFESFLESGRSVKPDEGITLENSAKSVSPGDVATLIYTSGTTGEPKGVMLTHTNIVSNVIDCGEKYDFSHHDTCLSVLPLSHIFERSAMYLYIFHGMSVYYAEAIDRVPQNLSEVQPTVLVGVPRIFEKVFAKAKLAAAQAGGVKEKLFDWAISIAEKTAACEEAGKTSGPWLRLQHAIADRVVFRKLRKFFGGRIRLCITGGAALSDDISLIFSGAGIPIMQGYGLTETSPVLSSNNPVHRRLGTVGKPIRNTQIRIAEDGEIEAAGPGVMLGYYNKPDATHEAFTEDGWFRTGDIGAIDTDGFLRITDRKKELFKTSGGKYIAPSPIEQVIRSSRFVSQAVLVGNERKFPAALIVPNFDMLRSYAEHKGMQIEADAEMCNNERIIDLIERQIASLTGHLSQFEKVKRFALLEREFSVEGGELTPTLKIKRRVINEKYKDVIDRIYREAEMEKPVK